MARSCEIARFTQFAHLFTNAHFPGRSILLLPPWPPAARAPAPPAPPEPAPAAAAPPVAPLAPPPPAEPTRGVAHEASPQGQRGIWEAEGNLWGFLVRQTFHSPENAGIFGTGLITPNLPVATRSFDLYWRVQLVKRRWPLLTAAIPLQANGLAKVCLISSIHQALSTPVGSLDPLKNHTSAVKTHGTSCKQVSFISTRVGCPAPPAAAGARARRAWNPPAAPPRAPCAALRRGCPCPASHPDLTGNLAIDSLRRGGS